MTQGRVVILLCGVLGVFLGYFFSTSSNVREDNLVKALIISQEYVNIFSGTFQEDNLVGLNEEVLHKVLAEYKNISEKDKGYISLDDLVTTIQEGEIVSFWETDLHDDGTMGHSDNALMYDGVQLIYYTDIEDGQYEPTILDNYTNDKRVKSGKINLIDLNFNRWGKDSVVYEGHQFSILRNYHTETYTSIKSNLEYVFVLDSYRYLESDSNKIGVVYKSLKGDNHLRFNFTLEGKDIVGMDVSSNFKD